MTKREWLRLRRYYNAAKLERSHREGQRPSKRSVKSNGKAIGQVLKRSTLSEQVHVETIFPVRLIGNR